MAKNKWMEMLLKDEKNVQGANVTARSRVKTASPSLNWALGGGLYKGYTLCLYGPEGSGKSLISTMGVGALHQEDPDALAVYISTEMRAPSPERLRTLGVDPERILIRQANTMHDVFDWITSKDSSFTNSDGSKGGPGLAYLLEEGAPFKAMVIDSIKGIQGPKEQALESVEQNYMGDLSKFLNPALRAILPVIRKYDMMTIFVQQVNMNMDPDEVKYQNKKYLIPSGQALKHFCESMALVERVNSKDSKIINDEISNISDKSLQQGHTVRVKVEKANLDKPFREAEFKIDYDRGVVETPLEIAKLGQSLGVIYHPKKDGKEIINQWALRMPDGTEKVWIGFANALKDIEASLELQAAIILGSEKI
jgi:RecA/RadA recombinase